MTRIEAADLSAVTACGPVEATADQLESPRAFKHTPHPLQPHDDAFQQMCETAGIDWNWEWRDQVWRHLIDTHLVPLLDTEVGLTAGSYNSAWARFVDGLTNPNRNLAPLTVTIDADTISAAYAAAANSELPPPAPVRTTRPSVLDAGIRALSGRYVTVFLNASSDLTPTGVVLAVNDDSIVLTGHDEEIAVIPAGSIAYITTAQLTPEEDAADETAR